MIEDRTKQLRNLLRELWNVNTSEKALAIEDRIVALFDVVQNEARREVAEQTRLANEAKAETERTREINVRMIDIQASLRTELAAEKDENATLRVALQSLRMDHFVLEEDCWYSCPKSGRCCDDSAGTECTCSADRINAIIDAALGEKP